MAGGERGVVTVGGKGNSLSTASVFDLAANKNNHPPPIIKIDTSARFRSSGGGGGGANFQLAIPSYLTPVEIRASLIVLLNKLLVVPCSAAACSCLLDFLNNHDQEQALQFSTSSVDEEEILKNLWSDAILLGISSLLDYESSALSTFADASASLSSEALRADVISSLNSFTDSADASSSVATDLKVLLNGSKLVGTTATTFQFSNIPRIHASLRSVSRSLHSATRVELNSPSLGAGEGLLSSLLSSLAIALQNVGKSSWTRSMLCFDSLLLPAFVDIFNSNCPTIPNLDQLIKSFLESYLENDYVKSFHLIHALSDLVRKILSWEAAASFVILELIESIKSPREEEIGNGNSKEEKKKDKRKKVMGKGTTVLIQYIKDILQLEKTTVEIRLQKIAGELLSLFSFEEGGLDCFVQKVKDVVDSNESRRLPKLPKGTRDFAKEQMAIRERAFSIIGKVFKRHGAMALDTPVFELRETLTGKYGEDSKLIYDLADQGGELCSLRYDLTVPFARYVAMNGLTSFRRYQMAKVYRRDNPSKGRFREFYQCDFDIAGDETVGADFEVIRILTELLNELKIGDYEIKLNHRKLLDGMLSICGVPSDKVRTICSSIDKLDKQSFEQIKREMVDEKGLDVKAADKIGSFVMRRGHPLTLLAELKKEGSEFLENSASSDALNDLEKLFDALERARCLDKVVLDMSLARGLDYYTGVIYEAVFKGDTQVGSIAAGGRYDNLIGMFGTKRVPAIGVSLGIERVFTIMEQLQKDPNHPNQGVRATETQVLVSIFGDDTSLAAELVSQCWDAKLKAEFMVHKRQAKHFDRAKESRIPWMVIVGDRGVGERDVKLKNTVSNEEVIVNRSKFVEELVKLLNT